MDARRIFFINLTVSITLIFTVGALCGYALGFFRASRNNFPEIKKVSEVNSGISTIKLMSSAGGKLTGTVSGRPARLAYSADHIIDVQADESFEIPLSSINLANYYKASALPTDAKYIASRTGKYYYSVFDKRALNLSEKNRLYFSSESEAENMGYVKK